MGYKNVANRNKFSVAIKIGKCIEYQRDRQLIKKDSTSWIRCVTLRTINGKTLEYAATRTQAATE
jgi:hypothetical protein